MGKASHEILNRVVVVSIVTNATYAGHHVVGKQQADNDYTKYDI